MNSSVDGIYVCGDHRKSKISCHDFETLQKKFEIAVPCGDRLATLSDETIVASSGSAVLHVLNTRTKECALELKNGHQGYIYYGLDTIPAGSDSPFPRVVSGDTKGVVVVWNGTTGEIMTQLPYDPPCTHSSGHLCSLKYVGAWNASLFVMGSFTSGPKLDHLSATLLRHYDLSRNVLLRKVSCGKSSDNLFLSPTVDEESGLFFTASCVGKTVQVWSRDSDECIGSGSLAGTGSCSYFAKDLSLLFVGLATRSGGTIEVFDPRNLSSRVRSFQLSSRVLMGSGIVRVGPDSFMASANDATLERWASTGKIHAKNQDGVRFRRSRRPGSRVRRRVPWRARSACGICTIGSPFDLFRFSAPPTRKETSEPRQPNKKRMIRRVIRRRAAGTTPKRNDNEAVAPEKMLAGQRGRNELPSECVSVVDEATVQTEPEAAVSRKKKSPMRGREAEMVVQVDDVARVDLAKLRREVKTRLQRSDLRQEELRLEMQQVRATLRDEQRLRMGLAKARDRLQKEKTALEEQLARERDGKERLQCTLGRVKGQFASEREAEETRTRQLELEQRERVIAEERLDQLRKQLEGESAAKDALSEVLQRQQVDYRQLELAVSHLRAVLAGSRPRASSLLLTDDKSVLKDCLTPFMFDPTAAAPTPDLFLPLSSGTYGNVYRWKWNGEHVAIKVPHPKNDGGRTRRVVERAVKCMMTASHPHLLRVLAHSLAGPAAIVTELCRGPSVYSLLHSDPSALSWHDKTKIALECAQGMAHLHACQFVHRDLNWSNVMLSEPLSSADWRVVIIDFGFVWQPGTIDHGGMSTQGGTLGYIAPEVYDEKKVISYPCDVYSFGIMLYVLLTGNLKPYGPTFPMEGDHLTLLRVAEIIKNGARPDLALLKVAPEKEAWLKRLLKSSWAGDPADRLTFSQIVQKFVVNEKIRF